MTDRHLPRADVPVSVVVATRDRPERLERCLEAVLAVMREQDELIVVDSASVDGRTAAVAIAAGAQLIRCALPGASRARNAGWRAARHSVVAFTDDDCRPGPGWVAGLAAVFVDAEVGWATGPVSVPPGQEDTDRPVALVPPRAAGDLTIRTPEPVGSGNNCAIRTDVLADIGGFDERLGPGTWLAAAEDLDVFDRLLASGVPGRYVPAAVMHHEQWRDRRALLRLDWGYGKGQGARLALIRSRDPDRGARRRRELLWTDGVASAWRDLRAGYEFGCASTGVRTAGTAVGYAYARARLRDNLGHGYRAGSTLVGAPGSGK
jgi:glycosyltransferase involved in cell wall biosynthesis